MVLNPLGCAEDGYGKNSLPHAIEEKPVQRLWFRAETVALTAASASTGQADEQNENFTFGANLLRTPHLASTGICNGIH